LEKIPVKIDAATLYIDTHKEMQDLHQYSIDSEGEQLDIFEQDLYRNTRVYDGLIKMLQFDADMASSETKIFKPYITLLIKKIYRIMAKACKDNLKNKQMMTTYLDDVILYHFEKPHIKENENEGGSETQRNSILNNENKGN